MKRMSRRIRNSLWIGSLSLVSAVSCDRSEKDAGEGEFAGPATDAVTFQPPTDGNSFENAPFSVLEGMEGPSLAFEEVGAREFRELTPEERAALEQLIEEFRQNPERRAEILEEIEASYYGAEVLPLIREIFGLGDEDLNLQAVEILAGNTSPEVLPVLEEALKQPSEDVQLSAVYASSQVRDEALVQFLSRAFENESEAVRLTGLDVLENQTANNRFKVYDAAMGSSHSDVQMAAIGALEMESSPDSIEIAIKGMESSDPEVRAEAQFSLEFQLDQTFQSAAQAREWWAKNRSKFDQDLIPKE